MNKPPFIMLKINQGSRFLKEQEITACIASGNYTKIVLANKDEVVVSKKLKTVEDKLNESRFCRIHNSHIINIEHLKDFNHSGDQKVTMSNGLQLEVSKRKKTDFLARFTNL